MAEYDATTDPHEHIMVAKDNGLASDEIELVLIKKIDKSCGTWLFTCKVESVERTSPSII